MQRKECNKNNNKDNNNKSLDLEVVPVQSITGIDHSETLISYSFIVLCRHISFSRFGTGSGTVFSIHLVIIIFYGEGGRLFVIGITNKQATDLTQNIQTGGDLGLGLSERLVLRLRHWPYGIGFARHVVVVLPQCVCTQRTLLTLCTFVNFV